MQKQVQKVMKFAIAKAQDEIGKTGFNPSVCAVATNKNFEIINFATTAEGGRPHAETILIEKLSADGFITPKSLYLFVTLEPCSHYGKTPPCVEAVIRCGFFDKVFVSQIDPDKRVSGMGINKLKNAGLETQIICQSLAFKTLYREYCFARTNERPFVSAKIACSLDGKIASPNGESKWLSSTKTRQYTNFLRHKYDAILVGSKTYAADNPSLTCRAEGLEKFSPQKFVLSSNKNLQLKDDFNLSYCNGNLQKTLGEIYNKQVNHLLVEGGAGVVTSFLKAGLVNRLFVVFCPLVIGKGGLSGVGELNIQSLAQSPHFVLESTKIIENNIIASYLKV